MHRLTGMALSATLLVMSAVLPADASDLTGIFVEISPAAELQYFDLTDSGEAVTGLYWSVRADMGSPDGVRRSHVPVSGRKVHLRIIFDVGTESDSYTATADITRAGFILNEHLPSGQIRQLAFRRTTIPEINVQIAKLTRNANEEKAVSSTWAEYNDARRKLQNDLNARPAAEQHLQEAQDAYDQADASVSDAEVKLESAQTRAAKAQKAANVAAAVGASYSSAWQAEANDLQARVNEAQAAVNNATAKRNNASSTLDDANSNLLGLTEEIDRLQQTITRDKRALRIP